jgi:SAM-dependent methyltransferase
MPSDLSFTGERFLPECSGEIAYEHWHRYAFARLLAADRDVLDAACGEGYGTALLGSVAASAVGVDIDAGVVARATAVYGRGDRIRFVEGSCAQLPLPDASMDVVVSFETIEHLRAADQPPMIAEFARVLRPGGFLIISSPNKRLYSDARAYVNEFHLNELYRADLEGLLGAAFPAQRWYHQRVTSWSGIWSETGVGTGIDAWLGDAQGITPYASPEGMYFVVVAARNETALPTSGPHGSFLTDAEEIEAKRNLANAREAMRLDGLLRERDAALDRQTGHVRHLEGLVVERERIIEDMNRRLVEFNALREQLELQLRDRAQTIASLESRIGTLGTRIASLDARGTELDAKLQEMLARHVQLEAAIAAQDRVIAYRQSARWWLKLPWFRLKILFARAR